MKRISIGILSLFMLSTYLFSQSSESAAKKALLIYEENNGNINPWISLFKAELASAQIDAEAVVPTEAKKREFSKYDYIIIHGSVMAFTMREPIRDWLKGNVDFSGRNVNVFVTASSSSLKKYHDQLLKLLKKDKAVVVDSVSSATKNLSAEQKRDLVKTFVGKVK